MIIYEGAVGNGEWAEIKRVSGDTVEHLPYSERKSYRQIRTKHVADEVTDDSLSNQSATVEN
jgi:hypothetical protein